MLDMFYLLCQATPTQANNGGVPNMPPGFLSSASTNPYVYVEVGPDSVTVNSISAHVIATEHSNERQNNRPTGKDIVIAQFKSTCL